MNQEKEFKIVKQDIRRFGVIMLSNYGLKYQYKFGNEGF